MALLFKSSRSNIVEHINNIYKSKELNKASTCRKFRQVQKEGKRYVERKLPLYNLDMIISVGYRVNSKRGIIFRRWATKVLKEYLIKGYAVNQERLHNLEKTIKLIDIANRVEENNFLNIINKYSKALNLLDGYDHKSITTNNITNKEIPISYNECISIIQDLKTNIKSKIFAIEKDKGLESIIKTIYQSFDSIDLYPSIESKAANLLYLITKNHVFIDGNKRIAASIFIYYLHKNKKLYIDNNTLVTLTLLIAESNPKEKEILIVLIINLLN